MPEFTISHPGTLGLDPEGLALLIPGSPCLPGLLKSSVCPCLYLTPGTQMSPLPKGRSWNSALSKG